LTTFKVVLAGEKRGLLVYAGVFVRGTCSSLRGGFLKALVELLDIASMSVRCSAGPAMPLCDSQKPGGLACSGERWVGSPTTSKRASEVPLSHCEASRPPGAAGVIAHSSRDGLLGGVETSPDLRRLALTQRSPWIRFASPEIAESLEGFGLASGLAKPNAVLEHSMNSSPRSPVPRRCWGACRRAKELSAIGSLYVECRCWIARANLFELMI
jgi:hypothetical protein